MFTIDWMIALRRQRHRSRLARARKELKILPLLVCLLSGCATVDSIEVSGDPAAVPPFKTFSIHEEQFAFATDISAEDRARIAMKLREAATSALKARGYEESSNADVLVSLGAISRPTLTDEPASSNSRIRPVDTSVLDAGRPPSVPDSEPAPSGVGREGDLILYLLDPKTQRVVWRASSSGSATTPSEAMRKARATYAAMVAKLPERAK